MFSLVWLPIRGKRSHARVDYYSYSLLLLQVHSGDFFDDDNVDDQRRKRAQQGDAVTLRVEGYYHNDRTNRRVLFEDCEHTFVVGNNNGVVPEGLVQAVVEFMEFGEQEATFTLSSDVAYGDRPYTGSNGIVAPANSDVVMILSWNRLERDGIHYNSSPRQKGLLWWCC